MREWVLNIYFVLMPLATLGAMWYITRNQQQRDKKEEKKETMIKLNSMVTLKIKDEPWIGQVVEIRDNIALVMLYDNMHYHADLSELTLFTQKTPQVQK
jgi:preprotein translocase subunit YajC